MAKVKYDVRGVEGSRKALPAGVYNAKITQADVTKPEGKDQRIEVILEVVNAEKEQNGAKLYEYINLESEAARWKLLEYLKAVGEEGDTGAFDTDDHLGLIVGVKTIVRPADEARGFDERAAVRRMFPLDTNIRNGARKPVENLDEEPVIEPETKPTAEDEPEEAELTWIELDTMDRTALKQMLKDESIDFKVTKSKTDEDIKAAIANFFELGDRPNPYEKQEEPEEEEAEEEAEATTEAAEAEPAGDDDDYDEWNEEELKEELTQRSLSTRGSKRVLITRLRKDDAAEDKPF